MRQNPHVRICGGPGSATTLVYPTALCRELGINPVTLYRCVGPQGQLREAGEKVLAT